MYTHGYGVIASPTNLATPSGDPTYFLSDIPTKEQGITLNGKGAQIYFGENLSEYVIADAKQAEFNYAAPGCQRLEHAVFGQGRRQALQRRPQGRVRTQLLGLQPLRLGSGRLELEDPDAARHPRSGHQARAVPLLRRRPVPGRDQRAHAVGPRRLHDLRPLPLLAERDRYRRPQQRLQLRAQLREGDGRRLRRHGEVLRRRQEGPDHPVLPRGVPRPVHRLLEDAAGAAGAPALPGGPLQAPVRRVLDVPRRRTRVASTTATSAGSGRRTRTRRSRSRRRGRRRASGPPSAPRRSRRPRSARTRTSSTSGSRATSRTAS